MPSKKSVFLEEEEKNIKLRISVPESLQQRINEIEKKLKTLKPSVKFDYEKILTTELESAVNAAEKEIATLEKSGSEIPEKNPASAPELSQVKTVSG